MLDAVGVLARAMSHVGAAVLALWLISPVVPLRSPFPQLTPVAPTRVQLAAATLRQADRLHAAQTGFGGTAPAEVLAWRLLLHAPDADSLFLDLTRAPSRVAQLYGLIGLHVSNPKLYQSALVRARQDGSSVPTVVGCIVFEQPMADVLAEIDRGIWSREYLTGRLHR